MDNNKKDNGQDRAQFLKDVEELKIHIQEDAKRPYSPQLFSQGNYVFIPKELSGRLVAEGQVKKRLRFLKDKSGLPKEVIGRAHITHLLDGLITELAEGKSIEEFRKETLTLHEKYYAERHQRRKLWTATKDISLLGLSAPV